MATAKAKYIRMSPRKVRRVVDEIRGKDAQSAKTTLQFLPQAAAKVVSKVLNSAIANAKENESLEIDNLVVKKACVDGSIVLKRFRPMSRGRAFPVMKRTSNITIEVAEEGASEKAEKEVEAKAEPKKETKAKATKPAAKTAAKKPAAKKTAAKKTTTAKKTTAKKSTAKKPAAKKTTEKKDKE